MSTALRSKLLHRSGARLLRTTAAAAARSFSSDHPRDPIPNRLLRNQPRYSSRARQSFGAETDADFLEKFKLGLDTEKIPKKSDEAESIDKSSDSAESVDSDEIFRKMKGTGLIPNAVAMLDGLCKDGLVQDALKLFGEMRERGAIPEVVVYTAVVEGFCKAGKLDDAVRIFRKMEGNGVVANAYSYGVLIRGLCGGGGRVEEAFEFAIAMLEAGFTPNLGTFVGLVDGFCRERGLEEAERVIGGMRQKGFFFEEKGVKEYLEKKGPFLPLVWEAILGKKASNKSPF